MKALIDPHGRRVRKLRLSLTDKCNLRCHYCMPVDSTFMPTERYLSAAQMHEIVAELCEYGLEELRLTGGEPLVRKDFAECVHLLASLPLKKIGLTSNGILLDQHWETLLANRILHLNLSLDSLDAKSFHRITHGDHFHRVLRNLEKARELGFDVKVNVVAMKGVNDHELEDFINLSARLGIEVRFLEYMRIGHALNSQDDQFISAQDLIKRIQLTHELKAVVKEQDSTSFNYVLENGAQIGFIASETQAFCGHCSRWRLSADGVMRACLMKDDGLVMKGLAPEARALAYQQLLGMKPFLRPAEVTHAMNAIGG